MPQKPLARCKRHPSASAGWNCADCGAALCPDCVEARRMHTVDLLACRECGGQADPVVIHRSEQAPLATRLGDVWRYPFTQNGVALGLALGTLLTVLGYMTRISFALARWIPAVLCAGLFWGCFFAIVRSSARGENDVTTPDYSDLVADWVAPALRGLLATSVVWLPLPLYFVFVGDWDVGQYTASLLDDPMFYATGALHAVPVERWVNDPVAWLLGLTGLAYLPMPLVLAATGASVLDMMNPVKGVRVIRRLGRDYGVMLGALFTLGLVFLVVRFLASEILALDYGIGTRWLAEILEVFVPFIMARVLGLLLYTRGDVLGYGAPSDYWTPVLLHATPGTTLRVDGTLAPAPKALGAATPEAPAPTEQVQALARAVEKRDIPLALALYQMLEGVPPNAIAPALHLFVGQASATQGDYALAVQALEAAADVAPEDPLAPRALVLLGRVLDEHLRDPARAQGVYQYIVDRYPDTDASRFAQGRLPPTT
ncbi:MAG TPA: tetratricopeptide repeat protein [Archangium sp.]|uniref:B-box zinc finger protein n=1 Tax=Archangium sp. TaxID=1872627 RepID=UPI002EDB40A9